jgi:hypothetical protein
MGTDSLPPSQSLPYGWEWFEVLPDVPAVETWKWGARSRDRFQSCHLTPERYGVARSDDSNVGLFAASIVWRAFVDRHAVKSFRS